MRGFFSVDGKFYAVTTKMVQMVIITFLWIVGCIPIVTILTSTSSMYHTTVKCIRYDRGKPFEEFVEAYKKNLKQGIPLTLLYGAVGAAIAFMDYGVFFQSKNRTEAVFILAVGMLILTCVYLLNVLWIVPVFSRFANTLRNIIKLNFVMSFRYIIRSIPMFFIIVAAVICMLASLPLVIIFPSLIMLLISYISEPGLHKYMPKQEEDNGDWRYGFK